MQRFILLSLSTLMLTATVAVPAQATLNVGTSTCPVNAAHCTGSGGAAGR